eukprot:m.720979 g.720979  ORF g.720979 m.720979 type:complete len:1005 (-) comp23011_c0_seq1:245-3259(-)
MSTNLQDHSRNGITSKDSVNLADLVAVCTRAVVQSCALIRKVQSCRVAGSFGAAGISVIGARMKDQHDSRTYVTAADELAQIAIIECIRSTWPRMKIIGEEDESSGVSEAANSILGAAGTGSASESSLATGTFDAGVTGYELHTTRINDAITELFTTCSVSEGYNQIRLDELCIFVDPLDGSREFVHERLHAAQTLLGISWRGRAIVGIVGLPFHDGDSIGSVPLCHARDTTRRHNTDVDLQHESSTGGGTVSHAGDASRAPHEAHGIVLGGVVGATRVLRFSRSGAQLLDAVQPLPAAADTTFAPHTPPSSGGQVPGLKSTGTVPGGAACATHTMATPPSVGTGNFILAASASVPASEQALRRIPRIIADACHREEPCALLPVGGCGNKILHLLTGAADGALFNLRSSLWDTCALEALVTCMRGSLTTVTGFPIEHDGASPLDNSYGVFATRRQHAHTPTHTALCRRFRADDVLVGALHARSGLVPSPAHTEAPHVASPAAREDVQLTHRVDDGGSQADTEAAASAVDIARNINGEPFDAAELSEYIFGNRHAIASYTCPESDAVRYKQSHCCRLRFRLSSDNVSTMSAVTSAFYKRSVLRELPHAVAKLVKHRYKIKRDVQSLTVEASILASTSLQDFSAKFSNIHLALPYKVFRRAYSADNHPIDSRFGFLLRDFSATDGWYQKASFARADKSQHLGAALDTLAKWHAYFWCHPPPRDTHTSLPHRVAGAWPGGTYWHTTHQPPDQLSYIEQSWAHFQHAFANELETMVAARDDVDTQRFTTTVKRLASWLRQQAPKLASQAHLVQHDGTVSDSAYASLLHGDPKASNFFFRLSGKDRDVACQPPILVPPSTAEGVCGVEVGLIDFQWTGYGLPGTDVAYCIATCVAEDFPLGDDAAVATVMELVRWYHTATLAAFVELGTTSSVAEGEALFPWAELKRQFVAGWLDLAKTVIADHWQTITPDMMRARKGKLVFNAYNKSVRIAMWFVKVTCDLVGAAGPG